jgi:hypothetical protein
MGFDDDPISEADDAIRRLKADRDRLLSESIAIQNYVRDEIQKILKDERYHYKKALVQVNASLALIQVELRARMDVLLAVKDIQKGS